MQDMTPQAIVAELDKYIVGQNEAKRAVAVALRNRFRRTQLPENVSRDITPKNILMIGPTGVGKTEIARRVASLIDAPFVKVEATKFTEVGYVGRDVESIIQELVDTGVNMVHEEKFKEVQSKAEGLAKEKIINYLCQQSKGQAKRLTAKNQQAGAVGAKAVASSTTSQTTVDISKDDSSGISPQGSIQTVSGSPKPPSGKRREVMANLLENQQLEDQLIEIEVSTDMGGFEPVLEFSPGMTSTEMSETFNDFMDSYQSFSTRRRSRKVSVKEARRILTREEANKLIDFEEVVDAAMKRCEQMGVVFIDELDKVIGPKVEMGADVSGEGVQRDLLPIVGGSTVLTRYGQVKTDYVLFIGAGSFHRHKPSEMLPEFQGRFPLRVELKALSQSDLRAILTEPQNSLIRQYQALLATEGVELVFTDDAIDEIARLATVMNERMDNIGARRLHTIVEKVLEELSFYAPERRGESIVVDRLYVTEKMADLVKDEDLSRYIL